MVSINPPNNNNNNNKMPLKLEEIALLDNLEPKLDDELCHKIANDVIRGYEIDRASRADWDQVSEKALKIAKQTFERKAAPYEWGSNVKLPIIPTAVMAYASRAYPEIIRNNRVVHANVAGADPDGSKEQLAKRVAEHMSWQLLIQDKSWEPSFDKLLHVYSFLGTAFKKVYYDPITKMNKSELCLPDRIYVNNNIDSLQSARRITHEIPLYLNNIYERVRSDVFSDYLEEIERVNGDLDGKSGQMSDDPDQIHWFLEQFCYIDLDEDGYKEPYIVTLHKATRKIVRIRACFDLAHIKYNDKQEVIKIPPDQYFVDFHLIPSPDGSFYSLGYGQFLYPMNDIANCLMNQTIDAGTLSNHQSGFLGRGFRGNPGDLVFKPGEWKKADVSGVDLNANIVPLPVRDPSPVLLNCLQLIYDKTDKLASVSDIMQGQEQAQNVSPTTVLTLLEQGLKPYSAQQKRLNRSLTQEFTIIYSLNARYLDKEEYFTIEGITQQIGARDYENDSIKVCPVSDPSLSSDSQRMMRAQALFQMMGMLAQPLAPGQRAILANFLDSLQVPNNLAAQILQPPPPPPPNPEMLKIQNDMENDRVDRQLKTVREQRALIESQTDHMLKLAQLDEAKAKAVLALAQAQSVNTSIDVRDYIDEINELFELKGVKDGGVSTVETGESNPKISSEATEGSGEPSGVVNQQPQP